jgi:hypothetical protein
MDKNRDAMWMSKRWHLSLYLVVICNGRSSQKCAHIYVTESPVLTNKNIDAMRMKQMTGSVTTPPDSCVIICKTKMKMEMDGVT